MAKIGLLNAFGSTVGDNLEHHLIAEAITSRGHRLQHLYNFVRQNPRAALSCDGLVAGCGGILWKGTPRRDCFFIDTINMAKRAAGVSIGYNQGEPLEARWINAVNHMEYVTARDPWTFDWIRTHCRTHVKLHPSVAWTYRPPKTEGSQIYDLGLVLNRRAFEINVGTGNPWKLYPGLKGLKILEIPFAQPVEQPFTKTEDNPNKLACLASFSIQQCRVVYTQRLHGLILALVSGVPVIGHGGGLKVQSQASMCNYPMLRTFKELRQLDPRGWRELIREAEGVDPQAYVPDMRARAAKHIEALDLWLKTF